MVVMNNLFEREKVEEIVVLQQNLLKFPSCNLQLVSPEVEILE